MSGRLKSPEITFSRPFHGLTCDYDLGPSNELLGYCQASVSRTNWAELFDAGGVDGPNTFDDHRPTSQIGDVNKLIYRSPGLEKPG